MYNEAPATVEAAPPSTPSAVVVAPPKMTPEEAATLLEEEAKARVIACQRDIQAVLAKHRCELDTTVYAQCGPDGVTRHGATLRVVPA